EESLENRDLSGVGPAGLSAGHRVDDRRVRHEKQVLCVGLFDTIAQPRPLLLLGFPKAGTGGIEDEKLRIAVTEPVIGVAKKLPVAVAGVASRDLMVGDRHVTRLFQPIEKIPAKGVVGFGVVFDQITG